jgi:hypothetical protein
VSDRETPLNRIWKRAKDGAPRQKAIAATVHAVRRSKTRSPETARAAIIAEAATRGVTDLSDKELATMTDAVTTSAKEAASQVVTKGSASVKSLWTKLQTPKPEWIELPDNVAALLLRADQRPVDVAVEIEAPAVLERLTTELADDEGVRTFDVWIALDPETGASAVCVGRQRLGRVPATHAPVLREELQRRRFWVPARLVDGVVTVRLPDHA